MGVRSRSGRWQTGCWGTGVVEYCNLGARRVGTGRPIIPILRVARFEDEGDEENEDEVADAARYTPSLGPVWPRIFTV
jgi:hypothetical protein